MRKTVLATVLIATALGTVSACAKQDEPANSVIINQTVPNDPAAADANVASSETFSNATAGAGNDSAPLNSAATTNTVQ